MFVLWQSKGVKKLHSLKGKRKQTNTERKRSKICGAWSARASRSMHLRMQMNSEESLLIEVDICSGEVNLIIVYRSPNSLLTKPAGQMNFNCALRHASIRQLISNTSSGKMLRMLPFSE